MTLFGMELTEVGVLAAILAWIIKLILGIVKPADKQATDIALIKQKMVFIEENLTLLQVNHIPHIETDVKRINESLIRISTILEERLVNKK